MQKNKIPQIKTSHIILGSAKEYFEDSIHFLEKCIADYGNIFEVRIAHKKLIVLNDPEHVQHVLQKNQKNYKRHYAYDILKLLFGEGIITIDGEKWKKERSLMQPFFHKKSIKTYFDKINNATIESIHSWIDKPHVDLLDEMGKLTLNIISDCVLGGSIKERSIIVQENLPHAMGFLIERVLSPLQPPIWLPTKKNKKFKMHSKNLKVLVNDLIEQKKSDPSGNDLISMYLSLQKKEDGITSEQIFDEVMSVLAAGHESTAIALFALLSNVLQNPDVKQKVIQEYDQVTNGEPLRIEHLIKLEYVNKVIKEANRLSTPAWSIGRSAIEEDHIDGYTIKKGASVIISPYLMHRNETYWPDARTFDPERFNSKPKHIYSYIPFGGGAKMCIGLGLADLEMQIILYHFLQSKSLLKDNTPLYQDMIFDTKSLTLRPTNDTKVIPPKKYLAKSTSDKSEICLDDSLALSSCPFKQK